MFNNNSPRLKLGDRQPSGRRESSAEVPATGWGARPTWWTGQRTGAARPRPRPVPFSRSRSCPGASAPGWWRPQTRGTFRCWCRCCCPRSAEERLWCRCSFRSPATGRRTPSDRVRVLRLSLTGNRHVYLASLSSVRCFWVLAPLSSSSLSLCSGAHLKDQRLAGKYARHQRLWGCRCVTVEKTRTSRGITTGNHGGKNGSTLDPRPQDYYLKYTACSTKLYNNVIINVNQLRYPIARREHDETTIILLRRYQSSAVMYARTRLASGSGTGGGGTLPVWRENQCCQRSPDDGPIRRGFAAITILYRVLLRNIKLLPVVACGTWVNNNNITSKHISFVITAIEYWGSWWDLILTAVTTQIDQLN